MCRVGWVGRQSQLVVKLAVQLTFVERERNQLYELLLQARVRNGQLNADMEKLQVGCVCGRGGMMYGERGEGRGGGSQSLVHRVQRITFLCQ
jgi:hypothetical protein